MACRRLVWGCRIGPAPSSSWRRSALTSAEHPRPDAPIKSGPGSPPQAGEGKQAFGVYVHWPFCLSKCPYCDFNSHVRHAPIDEERFSRAFAREIETTAARAPSARRRCHRAHRLRSLFVRSDLRPSRPDTKDVGGRVETRDRGGSRASVALSTHDRTGDAVLRFTCRGQTEDAGRGNRARAL